jgi:hypothetical protein
MDGRHFDTLIRSLGAARPRRSLAHLVAGLVLGGTVGASWLSEAEARRRGKGKRKGKKKGKGQSQCPPSCPECQQCVNGQFCTPFNGGTCGNSLCKECQGGQCVNKQNGTSCNNTGKCVNGTCTPAPDCDPKGTSCSTGDTCCSGDCASGACAKSDPGENCITSSDCNTNPVGGLNFCNLDFKCQKPVVAP